jgi:hypothetical protein
MPLKRKPKICKTCNLEKIIFSNGNCESCYKKKNPSKLKKTPLKSTVTKPKSKSKKLPTIPKLKKSARYWFQRYIRLRDLNTFCIYGSNSKLDDIRYYDACHYLKFELYPEAGFDEDNVHGGSKGENIRDNTLAYRRQLILRKGEDFVNNLENKYIINREGSFKFTREFLLNIIETYKEKCNQIENK